MLKRMRDKEWAAKECQRLLPILTPDRGGEILELRVNDVQVTKSWTVQYEARFRRHGNGLEEEAFLNFQHFPAGDFDQVVDRLRRRVGSTDCAGLGDLAGICSEQRLVVTPFPLDLKLTCLDQAADPEAARIRFSGEDAELYQADRVEIRPLRYIPSRRCQLSYRFFKNGHCGAAVLGKVFRDERGAPLQELMNSVAVWFTQQGAESIRAPRSMGYLPEWRMLLQEVMPGETLFDAIRLGRFEAGKVLSAGSALALLHRSGPFAVPEHRMVDELTLLEKSLSRLIDCGLGRRQFEEVLNSIRVRAVSQLVMPQVVVHRDFYDKQVLVSDDQIVLIDLDTLASGPAELDVANFCSHLYLRALQGWLRPQQALEAEEAFAEGYRSKSDHALDDSALDFFRRASFFRLACRYQFFPRNDGLVDCLLDLAARGPHRGLLEAAKVGPLEVLR